MTTTFTLAGVPITFSLHNREAGGVGFTLDVGRTRFGARAVRRVISTTRRAAVRVAALRLCRNGHALTVRVPAGGTYVLKNRVGSEALDDPSRNETTAFRTPPPGWQLLLDPEDFTYGLYAPDFVPDPQVLRRGFGLSIDAV